MADNDGQKEQSDKTEQHTNKEINSSESGGVSGNSGDQSDNTWRDADVNKESGDPGRTPGSAEGEDDPEYTGS